MGEEFLAQENNQGLLGGEVEVNVHIERVTDTYELTATLTGTVTVACTRCGTPAPVSVETQEYLLVKLGAEYQEESAEELIIPRGDARLDLTEILYEWVVLSLPITKGHAVGSCPPEWESLFRAHAAADPSEQQTPDPRWAQLLTQTQEQNHQEE